MMFIEQLKQLHAHTQAKALEWLLHLQKASFARLQTEGLPTHKSEAWRYTSLKDLTQKTLAVRPKKTLLLSAALPLKRFATGCHLVFCDGHFVELLSDRLPKGVEWATRVQDAPFSVEEFLAKFSNFKHDALTDVQMGFLEQGLFLRVRKNTKLTDPIRIIHYTTTTDPDVVTLLAPRQMLLLEEGAEVLLTDIHLHRTQTQQWILPATDVVLMANARCTHEVWQEASLNTLFTDQTRVCVARDAFYAHHHYTQGAQKLRHALEVYLQGTGAACELLALAPVGGGCHLDQQTLVHHLAEHTTTEQNYKTVIADHGNASFLGLIHVHKVAQKTSARQLNQNLLLSHRAQANTRPQLQIEADDVTCSHGATVGQLSEDALFYLQSRGIPLAEAKAMLIKGFAMDVLQRFVCAELRARLMQDLQSKMFASGGV